MRHYTITCNNGSLTVTPAPVVLEALNISANNISKTYGAPYIFTGQEFSSTGLIGGQTIGSVTLTSLGAPASAAVGGYKIVISNATGGTFNAGNYTITYNKGILTVTPVAEANTTQAEPVQLPLPQPQLVGGSIVTASVTPPPSAISMISANQTSGSVGTVSADGLANRETLPDRAAPGRNAGGVNNVVTSATGIVIQLVSQPSSGSAGIITVAVPKTSASPGSNFTFQLPEQVSLSSEMGKEVKVSLANGDPLPVWLKYVYTSRTFVATNVPAGSIPITVLVAVGKNVWTVEIAEFASL